MDKDIYQKNEDTIVVLATPAGSHGEQSNGD